MLSSLIERNPEATVFISNLDNRITEEIIWELFIQIAPVISVFLPKDQITNEIKGYGFVELKSEIDSDYSIKILNLVKLFNKPLKISKTSNEVDNHDIGANIFINNLEKSVNEKYLYDSFIGFGPILKYNIVRDPDTGDSKGYAFISYDNFESSDEAIKKMNGKYFSNKQIKIEYSIKKDSKKDKHGSVAERLLAANRPIAFRAGMHYKENDENKEIIIPESINRNEQKYPKLPDLPPLP